MKKIYILFYLMGFNAMHAQDIDSIMSNLEIQKEHDVIATFKSPKLVLLQTNETQKAHNLAFWVGHRFGDIGGDFGGSHTLFGLDVATDLYLGLIMVFRIT